MFLLHWLFILWVEIVVSFSAFNWSQLLWLLNAQWNCWTGGKKDKEQKQKLPPWGQRLHRKLLFGINSITPMSQRLISIRSTSICVIFFIICWACGFNAVYANIILFYLGGGIHPNIELSSIQEQKQTLKIPLSIDNTIAWQYDINNNNNNNNNNGSAVVQ